LRGAIEWSYDLLSPDEQAAFRCLAVFRSGCTLEGAEAVAGADLDTIQSLVEKSLVRHVEERFRTLETIRQYAADQLDAAGETDAVQRRHAEFFLALAEAAYPNLKGDPKRWLDQLEAEHDNLRAVLDRMTAAGETQLVIQLAGALWKFWYQRGHIPEGRRRLEAALAADPSPTAARARALNGASGLTAEYGDTAAARRFDEEALALYRALGDPLGIANTVFLLGHLATLEHDWATARPLLEESIKAFRELGDDHYVLLAMEVLAETYDELGDRDRALPLHEATLKRARAQGNRRMEVAALHSLAHWARLDGRVGEALKFVEEAHRINLDLGQSVEIIGDLSRFARILAADDRLDAASRLLARSLALGEELGVSRQYEFERDAETLAILHARLDEATLAQGMAAGLAMTVEEAVAFALSSST
jgi:tetratricopeptide (TPR) repeat protein